MQSCHAFPPHGPPQKLQKLLSSLLGEVQAARSATSFRRIRHIWRSLQAWRHRSTASVAAASLLPCYCWLAWAGFRTVPKPPSPENLLCKKCNRRRQFAPAAVDSWTCSRGRMSGPVRRRTEQNSYTLHANVTCTSTCFNFETGARRVDARARSPRGGLALAVCVLAPRDAPTDRRHPRTAGAHEIISEGGESPLDSRTRAAGSHRRALGA